MSIKKLVATEVVLEEELTYVFPKGYKYVEFIDPETGIYYRPKVDYTVTGESLEDLFDEVIE